MSTDVERVAILMATRNGARFLDEQMISLAAQTWPHIDIWASDDGSTDETLDMLESWRGRWTKGRMEILCGPKEGFAANFRSLIISERIDADYFAFCDQDDIWQPAKLERAVQWMKGTELRGPLLFCSRTLTMEEAGTVSGRSPLFARAPSFRNALVQSIAGGNTMVMNRTARQLLAEASRRTGFVSHDWWSYLIVAGAGGAVHYAAEPLVKYRQHVANQVGANVSWRARYSRLRRLLGGQISSWSDSNMAALGKNRDLLTADALQACDLFLDSRKGNLVHRFRQLRASGVYRQTRMDNLALHLAVLLRLI